MSLKIRFHFDGRCTIHPRYNPEADGQPQHKQCAGCESLFVIFLYSRIARQRAEAGEGLTVCHLSGRQEESAASAGSGDGSHTQVTTERREEA